MMKLSATIIFICLTFFLCYGGCSREEPPPPPVQNVKVVKPIKRPAPEKAKASLTDKERKATTEAKEGEAVKTAALAERALKTPETDERKKETAMEEVPGYYIVKQGDNLSRIATGEDVYEDSLKWPILYRLNMDKLGKLKLGEGFPDRELPEGIRLKISTPAEIRENLKRRPHNVWVVNVLSATTSGEIIPAAIRLVDNGYLVYITRAKVKGKDWMRLRVGFFKDRAESDTEAKKIMTMLNLVDSWASKIRKTEFEEFGGY
jgi:hypothetical protein